MHHTFASNYIEMLTGLTHLHSSFRYLVLLFIVLALVDAVLSLRGSGAYTKRSKIFALLGLILSHIQLLVGLLLYFMGGKGLNALLNVEGVMKDAQLRFYAIEHGLMMIIAIALITIGYSKAKKQTEASKQYKTIAIFYGLALAIIFVMIPWPFLKDFGAWF